VSIPLIGEVPAVGLTSPELQESIRTALSPAYLQDARVNVEVLTFRPFYILGEVNKPGEYPFTNGLTVSKAVATASGYTYRANAKKFYVKRDGEDKERLIDSSSNAVIGPGDVIRIPERYF
jgi:protein involved in polysaccharide export with SLBB domain